MKPRPFALTGGALAVLLVFGLSASGAPHHKTEPPARKQVGKASYYSKKFAGRKMADGTPMQMDSDSAAHKTLPLGSRARVTNLETGESATVVIRDRGPHVPGRIIDLSPSTAREIGITPKEGVGRVTVEPIRPPSNPAGPHRPGNP
jgi:rare lipoprotein A